MKFNNLLYTTPLKLKGFSGLLFIMVVQISLGYFACTVKPHHTKTPVPIALWGWSLVENTVAVTP